jgi:hypothetical protein
MAIRHAEKTATTQYGGHSAIAKQANNGQKL